MKKKIIKKLAFCFLPIVLLINPVKCQNFELVGLIDTKLIFIDSTSGNIEPYLDISDMPESENLTGLTFISSNSNFYSIRETTNNPSLISISKAGKYEVVGNFRLNGVQIASVESLAFNNSNNKLYASVSLNGGVANNDFYSESIVEVNIATGECFLVTKISTAAAYPDIDVMTFKNNILYMYDGIPPSGDTYNLFSLDINNVSSTSSPQLIYENNTYLPISDFTATDQNIYFTEKRNLYKYNFSGNTLTLIGLTHTTGDYNGKLIKGVSKMNLCSLPTVNLGDDIKTCDLTQITLSADFSGDTYEWQDGSTEPEFSVTKSGEYWVKVRNSCGVSSDTINLLFDDPPSVDLGTDKTICNELLLDATFPGATYKWQDGSTEATLVAKTPGSYSVEVKNSCGSVSDTIWINIENPPSINLGEDRPTCSDVLLDATYPGATYKWQDGSNQPTCVAKKTGVYSVEVKNLCGTISDTVNITFENPPSIDLVEERTICNDFLLDATFPGSTYKWQDGSTEATFVAKTPGNYSVEVRNSCGIVEDSIYIKAEQFNDFFIPNIFTPNGDRFNEFFEIDQKLLGSKLVIVNRWGKPVYSSDNYQGNWNGSNLSKGIYYYQITDPCGKNYKGCITILY